jgi:hypothetical protein
VVVVTTRARRARRWLGQMGHYHVVMGHPSLGPLIAPGHHGLEAAALGRSQPNTVHRFDFLFSFKSPEICANF